MACVVIARNGLLFKPLFAMTNRKSYQITIFNNINLKAIFVNTTRESALPNEDSQTETTKTDKSAVFLTNFQS